MKPLFNSILLFNICFGQTITLANILRSGQLFGTDSQVVINKICSNSNECDHGLDCISNYCQLKKAYYGSETVGIEISSKSTVFKIPNNPTPETTIGWDKDEVDLGTVQYIVWISFVVPFVSIMTFVIICGYRYRKITSNRNNTNRIQADYYRPAIIETTFEEMQSRRDGFHNSYCNCPPPEYDKIDCEQPPSYESIQKSNPC